MDQHEHCDECGFDSEQWTRQDLTHAFPYIAARAAYTLEALPAGAAVRRPDAQTWSMLEYLDHTRQVIWSHRFIVDIAQQDPGIELGTHEPPPPGESVGLDETTVLRELTVECLAMEEALAALGDDEWQAHVTFGGDPATIDGAAVHAMHDATHHLHDLGRIRVRLGAGSASPDGTVRQINVSAGGVPKTAVAGSVAVDARGVDGDRQRNRRHHGRPFQALCLYSAEVIDALRAEGHPITAGAAGENLTLAGLDWAEMRPGTILDIGEVQCELTAYAVPCGKNNQWFADGDSQRILHENHPGWSRVYASVRRGGRIEAGAPVVVEPAS